MTCLDLAKQYLHAWNVHDADAIVNTFAVGAPTPTRLLA
jgi:hypothetical protein